MLVKLRANDIAWASCMLCQIVHIVERGEIPQGAAIDAFGGSLGALTRACEDLGLRVSLTQVQRLQQTIFTIGKMDWQTIGRMAVEVQSRIVDELESHVFLQIAVSKIQFYEQKTPLFGQAVNDCFPSASYDIEEAGKCFSLERNTACVFHLMRVLEVGLAVLASKLSVQSHHTNWQKIIEQIESKVRSMGGDPARGSNRKDEQEFYSQAAHHFMILKDAWRNYTAHARGKYTEEEARRIFDNVRGRSEERRVGKECRSRWSPYH